MRRVQPRPGGAPGQQRRLVKLPLLDNAREGAICLDLGNALIHFSERLLIALAQNQADLTLDLRLIGVNQPHLLQGA
ncbi:hypothetical protein D3C73_615850 [compost metagenome]